MITSTRCLIFLFVGCVVSLVACASPGPRVAGCPKSSGGPVAAGVDSTPTAAPVQGPGESTSPTPTADEIRDYYRKERRRFGTDPDTPTIASVAFSQNFEVDGIVFAGSYLNGLFCSNDRGQSWTAVNGLADSTVWSVVLSPAFETDGTVLAGTPGGVFRSHDRGQSWRLVSHDRVGDMVVSGAFESDRTMFAATADGVGRSTDAGETWQTVMAAPRIGNAIRPLDISPGFERDNTVFMVSRRSIDGGDTWEPFVEESTGYNQRAPIALELSSAFNSDRTMFVYDGYSGVLRSTDGGATWESIGGPTPGAWNVDMAVSPASDADNTLYVSLGRTFNPPAGVFRFANGEWEQIAGKGSEYQGGYLSDATVFFLAISPAFGSDDILFASTEDEGLFRSTDRGDTWEPVQFARPGATTDEDEIPTTPVRQVPFKKDMELSVMKTAFQSAMVDAGVSTVTDNSGAAARNDFTTSPPEIPGGLGKYLDTPTTSYFYCYTSSGRVTLQQEAAEPNCP